MFYNGPSYPLEELIGLPVRRPSPEYFVQSPYYSRRRRPSPYVGDYVPPSRFGYGPYEEEEEEESDFPIPPSPRQIQHQQELQRQRLYREQQIRQEEERRRQYTEALRLRRLEELQRQQQLIQEQQRRYQQQHHHRSPESATPRQQHRTTEGRGAHHPLGKHPVTDIPIHSTLPPAADSITVKPVSPAVSEPVRPQPSVTPLRAEGPKPPVDPVVLETSASKIQHAYRAYHLRRTLALAAPKFSQLRAVAADLDKMVFLHLKAALGTDRIEGEAEPRLVLDSETGAPVPGVPQNKAYMMLEDGLLKLLLKLDGIESGGLELVREKRKEVVKSVNTILERLDERREREWRALKREKGSESQLAQSPEDETTHMETEEECTDEVETASEKPEPAASVMDLKSEITPMDVEPTEFPTGATSEVAEEVLRGPEDSELDPEDLDWVPPEFS
ncbi:hypothetical protein HDU93_009742 [Gonapodya sp. JEL0774]|nr:hypothetical protein HDU93_009742 [Gonapodya sp. JEL0774]